MGAMKTPGVYIVEKNAFPNSVVEVATAVPAFIGHTEIADNRNTPLSLRPWRISSMAEYHQYFGGAPRPRFTLSPAADKFSTDFKAQTLPDDPKSEAGFALAQVAGVKGGNYGLYTALRHFFQNGGGPCYIVSVGSYAEDLDIEQFTRGIDELLKEQEPTMLVIPEAVRFGRDTCTALQQAMLAHCGKQMRSRVAILDIWGGDQPSTFEPDPIAGFRDSLGINFLDFASAYYPWVNTSVVGEKELSYENIAAESTDQLKTLLRADLKLPLALPDKPSPQMKALFEAVEAITADFEQKVKDKAAAAARTLTSDELASGVLAEKSLLNKMLSSASPVFNTVMTEARRRLNVLPPSAAMAGIYTMVDNTRGVWKAPANVSLSGVISPCVSISAVQQEDLNVTAQGKSINAIRSFIGEGVLVWGARTLDGNSLDWRYINVRRTMIMLEESCRLAAKAMVFEPNTANTWVTIKSMISNFLTGIWKRGGLMGAIPEDAFSVHVGLGETMTPNDVLEGILRVTVLVAMVRPAEFIEITFMQQMPKS